MKTRTIKQGFSGFVFAFGAAMAGCGGSSPDVVVLKGGTKTASGAVLNQEAASKFEAGGNTALEIEKTGQWNEDNCKKALAGFKAAESAQGEFPEATYNQGLVYERCGKPGDAEDAFKSALKKNEKFHPARTKLAIIAFNKSGEKNFNAAIEELRRAAITDGQYKNVEANVALGMVYLKRNNAEKDKEGDNDLARAQLYAKTALAINDSFMPAYNLLALSNYQAALQKAGRTIGGKVTATSGKKKKEVNQQAMDLAILICSQAIRRDGKYAPIHNTAGMIQVELGNLNTAVSEFNAARNSDPNFYEAQMNFAAVNLQFRGFKQSEEAYRAAIKMRPNDYDAHLGLALAIRGQIDDANFDKYVAETQSELDAAKKIDAGRPEAYYNEAILTQEYKAKGGGAGGDAILGKAQDIFRQFVSKAGAAAEFADGVKRANERIGEIKQIIDFNKQSEADRKAAEAEAKNKAAEAEAGGANAGGDGGDNPPPDETKPK